MGPPTAPGPGPGPTPAPPPDRPRVALAMPYYDQLSSAAARGYYNATLGAGLDLVLMIDSCTSITPNAFNHVWIEALAARDRGEVTHFAMLHSDVGPTVGWLDVLHREMVRADADVISAVVPIKNGTGKTSTAVGSKADPWHPARYVMAHHRDWFPETFTAAHACRTPDELLLINTGCMLLDLRRDWWDVPATGGHGGAGFAWEFRTRLGWREEPGPGGTAVRRRIAEVAPEDWLMSRHVAEHGGRVAATWAVRVDHRGANNWSNAG